MLPYEQGLVVLTILFVSFTYPCQNKKVTGLTSRRSYKTFFSVLNWEYFLYSVTNTKAYQRKAGKFFVGKEKSFIGSTTALHNNNQVFFLFKLRSILTALKSIKSFCVDSVISKNQTIVSSL